MKTRKSSQVVLVLSLMLCLTALWFGAGPLAGVADGGVGGWQQYFAPEGVWVAAAFDQGSCTYCWGTYGGSCSGYQHEGYPPCNGGSISVAICSASSSAGGTTHAAG